MQNLPPDYSPRFPQVTVFKDREMQTIKELYNAAQRNGDHNVIVSLSDQIKKSDGNRYPAEARGVCRCRYQGL